MKRLLSSIIIITLLFSTVFSNCVFGEEITPLYEQSFEGEWKGSGWTAYGLSSHREGVLYFGTNTDSSYVSDGTQSLYILDNSSNAYTGVMTPLNPCESGTYLISFDAWILSGELKFEVRLFDKDENLVEQKAKILTANNKMDSFTIEASVGSSIGYIAVILYSSTDKISVGEGYFDNITIVKTENTASEELLESISLAKPGDEIIIKNGTYSNLVLNFNASGTAKEPITLKAQTPGQVVLTEYSRIVVSGSYIVIEGLRFEEVTSSTIVEFGANSNNCQLQDCAFYNCNPPGGYTANSMWVNILGLNTKISGCFFSGKNSHYQMIGYSRDGLRSDYSKEQAEQLPSDNHVIENCYFGDFQDAKGANGYEAIRMGNSYGAFIKSFSKVEGCFFYKCNGEGETISVKSCDNTLKNNTFYNTNGALVLRHGDRNEVYGNLFIGNPANSRVSGVRLSGEDHKIHDNYFYNLSNSGATNLYIYHGGKYETIENYHYYPVKNLKAYNNTFIGGDSVLKVGAYSPNNNIASDRVVAPEGKIYNNAMVSYSGKNSLIENGDPAPGKTDDKDAYHKVKFENNYAYGKDLGYSENGVNIVPEGINNEYFRLAKIGKYFKPENGTGADIEIVKKAPTSPFDIISDWVKEVYYDTGKVTFEVVANDPFNSSTAHINDIIPFDVRASVESGEGIVELFEDNNKVSQNSQTVSNNPTIKVIATPGVYKKLSGWEINGVVVDKNNMENMGVQRFSETELIISDIYKDFNITASFSDIDTVPEKIAVSSQLSQGKAIFAQKDSPLVVNKGKDDEKAITGFYKPIMARVPILNNYTISEYGIKISQNNSDFKVLAKGEKMYNGAYGLLLYNLLEGKTYYAKPYVIYKDSSGYETEIVGDIIEFTVQQ